MNGIGTAARLRSGGTAALLVLSGALLGIAADRFWLSQGEPVDAALTADTLADHLGLDPAAEASLSALLDTLHAEILSAAAFGPDSLQAKVDHAHRRIAESLPTESRTSFHSWMQGHHEEVMRRLQESPR